MLAQFFTILCIDMLSLSHTEIRIDKMHVSTWRNLGNHGNLHATCFGPEGVVNTIII